MVKIIEFPTKERKAENILQQLEAGSMQLEEMYDKLDSLHEMLHKAEEEAVTLLVDSPEQIAVMKSLYDPDEKQKIILLKKNILLLI